MSNRTLTVLMIAMIGAVAALFLINYGVVFQEAVTPPLIAKKEVRGVSIEHKGKVYTLNFDQQNAVIEVFNNALKVGPESYFPKDKKSFEFTRVLVHRFDKPDLEMTPYGYTAGELLYRIPALYSEGLFEEAGPRPITPILKEAYSN